MEEEEEGGCIWISSGEQRTEVRWKSERGRNKEDGDRNYSEVEVKDVNRATTEPEGQTRDAGSRWRGEEAG